MTGQPINLLASSMMPPDLHILVAKQITVGVPRRLAADEPAPEATIKTQMKSGNT